MGHLGLTVIDTRNKRELMNPPRIVNSSDDANFPRYISWSERMTVNRRNEYSIELPDPAMAFTLHFKKKKKASETLLGNN